MLWATSQGARHLVLHLCHPWMLQYFDRFIAKSAGGGPIAVVREFWEEQEAELPGVFTVNTLSKLRCMGTTRFRIVF